MGNLVLNGATSGATTLTPTDATTQTITLPANSGTVVTSASSGAVSQAMLAAGVAGNGPAFRAIGITGQNPSFGVNTKVVVDSAVFDTASCYDTSNYRFMPNVAGYYQVNGVLRIVASTTLTSMQIYLYVNGAQYSAGTKVQATLTNNVVQAVTVSDLVYLNGSTDYVELYGIAAGSGTLTFNGAGVPYNTTSFSASLVRAA